MMAYSLARSGFETHLKLLRWCGFGVFSTDNHILGSIHQLYRFIVLTCFTFYIIQELVYIFMVTQDLVIFARVMFLLLGHSEAYVKMATFCLNTKTIEKLLEEFNDPMFNPENKVLRKILTDSVRQTKLIVKTFVSGSFFTCMFWFIFPVFDFIKGKRVQFFYWLFGIDYNTSPAFAIITIYTLTITTLVAVGNTTLDAFIPAFLAQSKTQLTILRYNLQRLPETCKELTRDNRDDYDDTLSRELFKCMEHYAKIMQITKTCMDTFGGAILFQFACSGWIICMTAYKLANVNPMSVEFPSLVFFMILMLTEIFLFCYYGNEMKYESELISESVFAMSWHDTPRAFRRSLLVIMERAKRPITPTAGYIIPLSLDTFMKILKSSYTFYAVMKSTNNS